MVQIREVSAGGADPKDDGLASQGLSISNSYVGRDITIAGIAKADPNNVQEVAASQLAISNDYYRSVLGQARQSFVAAIVAASVGAAFFIAAVALAIWRNEVNAGTLSAIGGAIVECVSGLNFWLYGRTSRQLNSFHQRIQRTQTLLLGNSMCNSVSNEEAADALRAQIVRTAVDADYRQPVEAPNEPVGAVEK